MSAFNTVDQYFCSHASHFIKRDMYSGQHGCQVLGGINVVDTGNRNIFGDTKPVILDCPHGTDSCHVICAEKSGSITSAVKKLAGTFITAFCREHDVFNGKRKELETVCELLGEKLDLKGDVAAKLYPFTFLPVIIQYWEADEEFPANLKFMFDENILDYIHFETIFFMMGHIVKRIEEMMKTDFSIC